MEKDRYYRKLPDRRWGRPEYKYPPGRRRVPVSIPEHARERGEAFREEEQIIESPDILNISTEELLTGRKKKHYY